jgi:hypothetical protein
MLKPLNITLENHKIGLRKSNVILSDFKIYIYIYIYI